MWPIAQPGIVRAYIEDTRHYQLSGTDADKEWNELYPGGGIIRLGPSSPPYSISMFHELRCLDIIRVDLARIQSSNSSASMPPPSTLARHCMNYIRQMLLCYTDTRMDMLSGLEVNARPEIYVCRDWNAVYEAVKQHQALYG